MKVKILLDHVSRELNLAAKIKCLLESTEGNVVSIFHQDYINKVYDYDFFDVTFDGKYDILLIPSYNVRRMPETVLRSIASRSKIVIYHSEQLFNDAFDVEKLNLERLRRYRKHIAAHLVWGPKFASKLINKASIDASSIFIVGNYKFDFLSKQHQLSNKKVLLASDYRLGDMTDAEVAEFEKEYRVKLPAGLNSIYRNAKDESLLWIEKLAKIYPSVEFQLRPHPGENREKYEILAREYSNVNVTNSDVSYASDLDNSSLVLGFTSTSVMEVIYSNKLMISLDVVHFDKSFLSEHKNLLYWANFETVKKYVESINDGIIVEPKSKIKSTFNEYYHQGGNVCDNIVDALNAIYITNSLDSKFELVDYINALKVVIVSTIKFLTVKLSYRYNKLPFLNWVYTRSLNSYNKRCQDSEVIDNILIDKELERLDIIDLNHSSTKSLTKEGWVYY